MASQVYQNYQKQADSAYKKMNPFVRAGIQTVDAFADAARQVGADIAAGGLTILSSGYKLLGSQDTARFTDSIASGITSIAQDYASYSIPSSTQAELPFSDNFIPYKINVGGKMQTAVRLYKNAKGEIVDVRDIDGYSMFMSQDDIDGINKIYQDDPNKPAETSQLMWGLAAPKLTSTVTSLAAIALAPEAGAAAGLSQKASMFAYGYLTSVKGSYDAIKAQDPLISDDAATLYANTMGLVNGGLFLVTPSALLGKKAVETGYRELGQEYITLLKNGMRPNKAMTKAILSQYAKHGTEGALFGVGVEIVNKGVNGATNELTGRKTVDDEVNLSQLVESGVSMFLATSILGVARGGYRDKIMGDALYTGLKNYDKTLAEFENMANKGQISAQDFNRMTNLMSELKPIYDNLADMGEYNAQYKTALISLYAEKFQKQQKLNAMDSGEQPGVLGKAVNKVKSVLTKGPMPNRDALVKELNDIDKSIESMAIVNNPDFIIYTTSAKEVAAEEWPEQEEVLSKLRDPKTPLKDKFELYEKYKKQLADKKFYKNENGDFVPFTTNTLKVGKQYIFDPKSGKFLAIKGAVAEAPKEKKFTASGEEIEQEPTIIGAQVELPKYFSQGEQFTRDQLQEKLKDPAFIADMKAGRVQVDVFNDLEMEAYIENLTKEKQAKERKLLQEGPRALGPGEQITPTEPGPAEVLPDLKLNQVGDKEVLTEDGTLATVERAEDGNWYLNLENGKSQQIPVTDNANPSETIKQLGLRLPVEQNVPVAVPQGQKEITGTPIDITTPTGQEVGQVTVADDGVTFNIPEVGQVTWLKFNYTNKGELKTADVMMPDGKKMKIKDTDIVYDMAVALSNQTRARLGVTPEVANGAIEDIVEPIKQTFDKGMNAIYNVVVNAGDAAINIEKAYEGEPLTQQEQAAALEYLVTAANTINKIDTENATEKQNIIEWLSEAYDQVSAAEVTMEGPSELGVTQQGSEGISATKGEPSTPTKQRIVKYPEISGNTQRILKRVAGDQESIDALTNAIKAAYEAGTSPMEAAKQLGYAGEEYKRYLEPIIQDMKPEITEVEVKPEAKAEAQSIDEQFDAVWSGIQAIPQGAFGKEQTQPITAEQLKANATKPVVKWSSTELPYKTPLDIYDAIAQNSPELAPLMQEAINVTKQVLAIMDKAKVEGYPVSGGESVIIEGVAYPFAARLYSQLYNSKNPKRWEYASLAIEKFKKELQDAKDFLANPPSDAELAKIKAQREAIVLAKQQKTKKDMEEYRQNLDKEKIAADTRQEQFNNIVKELGSLTPEQKASIKNEIIKDGKVAPFVMKAATKLFAQENKLPSKTIFTKGPTLDEVAAKLGVKPEEVRPLVLDYIKNNNDKVYAEAYLESEQNYENDAFVKAVEKVLGDKGFLYSLTDFKQGDIVVNYAGEQYEVINPNPNQNGFAKVKNISDAYNPERIISVSADFRLYRLLTPPAEPTQAELMAKPIAMDVLKVETLFGNNGYDISIDYDNEAIITDKKTGKQVEIDELPENMQKAAEVYGEWVSNIEEMVGDPMEFVAKTRSEYEGELVPYEEIKPEALPEGEVTKLIDALQVAVENNPVKAIKVSEGSFEMKGGLTDAVNAAREADKKEDITTPSKIEFLPETITLTHLTRDANDKKNILKNGFDISRRNIDSPIPGIYFSGEDWSKMGRFNRDAKNVVYTDIKNEGLLYFDEPYNFVEYLKENNLPYQGEGLTKEQTDVLLNKGVKGIVLRLDYAGQTANELIVIDDSIIKNISEVKKEITKLPPSYWQTKDIAEAYLKAKADGSNPKLVEAVEKLLSAKPTTTKLDLSKDLSVADIQTVVDNIKQNGKPLSEFKVGDRVIWASNRDSNWMQYMEGTVVRVGDGYAIKRFPEAKEAKYKVNNLPGNTLVIPKPIGEPVYLGEESIRKTQPTEAEAVTKAEGGVQYIDGNPVGGTAAVGQYRPDFEKNNIVQVGKETKIILPDGTQYKAVYVMAPVNSVLASHDPNNAFRKTEGYPVDASGNTTNDRDYTLDNSAQTDVQRIAANPNFDLYLDKGQSVNVGPPVITADGFVVGGSGRKQAMDLFDSSQRRGLAIAMKEKEDDFGFSEEAFGKSKVPVMGSGGLGVFRMLVDYNEPYSKVSSAKFNQSEGKTKSEADTSLTFGTSLNENARAKELLFNTVGAYDTMGDFFNNLAAKRLSKDIMVKNGLVAEKDINRFFDQNGNWTPTGKEIFKKGLFATLFDEDIVRLLDTEGNVMFMDKIAKEMPTLATNFKLPADVNLKEDIQNAIRLQSSFHASGVKNIKDFLRVKTMFEKITKEAAAIWTLLDISTVRNNAFRGAIQSYNNSAEQSGLPSIFGDVEEAMSKADFIELILNKIPYEERQIIKNALADEGFGPRVEEQGSRYTRSMGAPRPKDGLGRYTRFGEEGTGGEREGLRQVDDATRVGRITEGITLSDAKQSLMDDLLADEKFLVPDNQKDASIDNIMNNIILPAINEKRAAQKTTNIQGLANAIHDAAINTWNEVKDESISANEYEEYMAAIRLAKELKNNPREYAPVLKALGYGVVTPDYIEAQFKGESPYTPRVEEDRTEYGRMYYSKKGDSKSSINGFYDPYSVQGKSANLGMDANGLLPSRITYEQALTEYNKFKDIKVFKTYDGKRCFLKIKAANGMYVKFNPFTAVPYTAGRGKIEANPDSVIPPATSPISEVVQPATPPAEDVLPQAERDFKNQQLFFDFNDDVQSVQDPRGKYFGFVSAANKIRKMTNLSKNEQEYFELLKDQVRNQTAVGKKKLAELRQKIGDERAVEIQDNIVNDLVESKLGRKLKEGEYATQTSTVKVSKDRYAVGATQIKSAADVAYIARMIETESVENVLLYMLDENGITTLAHISSGGISGTAVDVNVIGDYITTFKPKKIWIAHNHPSSKMMQSVPDQDLTKEVKRLTDSLGVELAGHVIVDFIEGKYIVLNDQGKKVGDVYNQADYKGAEDEIPVYINGQAATFDWSSSNLMTDQTSAINALSDKVTALRAGENVKGGFLVMNRANIVIGHFYLTGVNDVQDIIKTTSALGAATVITYGNFNKPVIPVDRRLPNGVQVLDHLTYQSERFTSALEEPEPVYDYTAVTMPRVEELVLPYDRNSSKLQQAVQQAMVDGFLKFDEVMFNLYDGHFDKDVIKMRKALDDVKDAYDNLSFENEDWIDSVSSIKEVSNFNVDNFLKSIQSPQKKKQSLRQQYDDFASWFEYNYPEARPYYKIEFDSQLGDAIFTVNGEPVQLNGEPISYSRWLNNAAVQKQWYGADKALVKNQPQMVWVDKDLTPTPKQYITDASYKLFPFQTHAVNAAIDYFEKGNKGFGLWDGQGVGKTREILAIANEMANRSGKPSLIITKNDSVIDQFKESANAMALRGIEYKKDNASGIIIGTYNDLVGGKVGKLSSYGTVVFDEAHMLKNIGSKRSKTKEELMDKMDHVVFATGTPMDKPSQLLYFAKYMAGEKLESMLTNAGLKVSSNGVIYPIRRKGGEPLLPEDKDLDDLKIIKKGLLRWRNQMIQEGAMIRREFPFYGTFGAIPVQIPQRNLDIIDAIFEERPGKVGLMEANRYQEHLKIPYVLDRVQRALDNGKQVVLFCTGVNPTEIKSMGITVPQFALEFSDILTKQGIAHSNIYGDNAAQKIEEAKKFQRGETKVAIATISSGGTGIDLDDQVGDAPREVMFVTLPWSADELDQAIRRVSRLNTKSPSVVDFLFADGSYADEHKQGVVYGKMQTMRNIQAGQDPDVIEMNNWKEGSELEADFQEPTTTEIDEADIELIGSAGYTPPLGATPHSRLSAPISTEPYNPEKEKEKAEKKESGMLGATSGSMSNLGTSVPPTTPTRPTPTKSSTQRAKDWLLGQKRTSIQAKVLQAMIDLGVPTTGEYHLNKKYLGVYEDLPQAVKLRYAQDLFVGLHETMHWIDYSVMRGLTDNLINNASNALLDDLENLYLSLYPKAKDKHDIETKIAEGLAVFMQYKLHDPDLAKLYPRVEKEIFSPGGKFYHPKMTEAYDAFRNILDEVQNMSSAGRISQRIASETPFDDKFTVSGWNALAEEKATMFDESYPLILWDEAAGDAHVLEASYLMWRRRGALAANIIKEGSGVLSGVSRPMYFAPNGKWTPLKYRMSDIVNNVVKVVKDNYADIKRIYPEMTTSLDALRTYLIARRVYYMGVKRVDLETQMAQIIADAQQDYAELLTYEEGTPEYTDKYNQFNSNHIRPLRLLAEKWKQVNTIIDNEGGSVKDIDPNFSASLLAFKEPLVHGVISSAVFDNKKGNYISEHDVTEVFNSLKPYMDKAARMYDFINDKVGIDMAVATGLMSQEFANQLKFDNALYPGYASFQKHINTTILDDADFIKINGGGTSKLRHNLRWKGSEYAIIDPLMSQASMIFEVFRKGMWNNTLLKLAQFSTLNDEFARGFMKLPMEYVPTQTSSGTYLKPQVKGAIPIGVMVQKVYSNGKVKFYAVNDRALFHFFSSIADENKLAAVTNNKLYKFAQQLKVLFEKGTTGWYLFWPAKNLTVDQIQLLLTSSNSAIPVISTLRYGLPQMIGAIKDNAVKHMQTMFVLNKLFPNRTFNAQQMNYVAMYLSMSGSSDSFFKQMESPEVVGALEKMFNAEEGVVPKIKKPFKGAIRLIDGTAMALTEITEILTKATELALAMKNGKDIEQAMLDAANLAPFYKRGSGKVLRAYQGTVPYLKPQFVMFYKTLLEGYRKNPGKMMLVMDAMMGLGALSILLLWDSLTEDEKNYYRGLDGKTASMYISIPSKLIGGQEGEISQYRVPEYIGSFNALGLMFAMAMLDNKELDQKQVTKTIASNIPSLINPYEYVASDKTILESVGTNFISNAPIPGKVLTEIWSDKKVTYYGRTPLTPRQTQSFPTEYQYKLGLGGTSSFAKYISDLSYNKVTPVQADLVMERTTGRTGKMIMDLFDNKELKNTFLKTREDIATNNKYYADFWSRYNEETGEFNVMRNVRYAAKIPKPGEPGYEDWKKEVRQKAETSEVYTSTHFMVMELLKMRDWARLSNNEIDVDVYNQMNHLMQDLYENKANETLMRDVRDAYRALKQEASRIKYESDVAQFNNYNDISKIDKYQIKLKTLKMIKGIK